MWTHNHPPSTTTASESFRHQRTDNSRAAACAPAPVLLLPNPISQLMVLCTPSEGTLLFPLYPPSTVSVKHAVPNKTIPPPAPLPPPFHFQIHLLPPKRSSFQDINFPCMNFSHCQSVHGCGWAKGVFFGTCVPSLFLLCLVQTNLHPHKQSPTTAPAHSQFKKQNNNNSVHMHYYTFLRDLTTHSLALSPPSSFIQPLFKANENDNNQIITSVAHRTRRRRLMLKPGILQAGTSTTTTAGFKRTTRPSANV